MDFEKVRELIQEGKKVKQEEYHDKFERGVIMLPYISGEKYDLWMNKIKIFSIRYLKEYPLYNEIIDTYNTRNNQWGTTAYESMMSYLSALLEDEKQETELKKVSEVTKLTSNSKIFISHSSLDVEYIKPFITLLERIGLGGSGKIFCSSLSGYYIPNGQPIYDYLKTELQSDTYVIMFLSDNYYNSPACMNEMGATWMASKSHIAILIPGFEYYNIKGAIDASKIWFKMNDKERINDFKNQLVGEFSLNEIDENIWERVRDEYIDNINSTFKSQKNLNQQVEVEDILNLDENNLRCVLRFINKERNQVVCKTIDISLFDKDNNELSFSMKFPLLKSFIIYGLENRRIIIDVPKNNISNISNFDFSRPRKWSVDSFWSTYTG